MIESAVKEKLELADLLKDGLFIDGDWIESKDQDPSGDVRLIQLADIGDGVFRNRSARFLTSAKAHELGCTFLEPGDVLVARMPEPLGRACIFPGVGQPAVTAVDVCILRPNPARAKADWLVKAINSPSLRGSMQQFVRGTTRQRISRKNLGTLSINVPPLSQQASLSQFIDSLEAKRLSGALHIAAAGHAVACFRRAVLAAACSGRLTADWRRERYGGDNPDNEVPFHWEQVLVGELATSIRGGSTEVPVNEPSDFPILRSSSVRPFVIDYSDIRYLSAAQSRRADNFLQNGDLLITRLSGSIEYVGNSAVVDSLDGRQIQYPDRLFCCRLKNPAEAPYVEMFFAGPVIRKQIENASRSAAGHQRISISDLRRFSLLRPPFDEQSQIVRRVDGLLSLADLLTDRIRAATTRVDRSSQAVLAKAFRGDLIGARS